jgi:DNA-binding NarL/FixJ family response regulator
MKTINIAIIEKSPLARVVLEDLLTKTNFNVVASTESIHYFLHQAKEQSIDIPDICLFDTMEKIASIKSVRKYYPETKIAVYDPIGTEKKRRGLHLEHFDIYIPKPLKMEHWITILQNIISRQE